MIPRIHPPCQLAANSLQKTYIPQLNEPDRIVIFADGQLVFGGDGFKAGIEGTKEGFGAPFDLERNNGIVRNDDGADIEVVRSYRGDHEIAGTGKNDRTTAMLSHGLLDFTVRNTVWLLLQLLP